MNQTKYRLKKEAREFFEKHYHTDIKSIESWKSCCIPRQLLEKVENVYIDYGIWENPNTLSIKSWDRRNGGKFEFTVYVNDMTNEEYKNVNMSEVMDEIQKVLNNYFKK